DPIDPKALWLNSQHIYALSADDLTARLAPVVKNAGIEIDDVKLRRITPLIQERIKTLNDVLQVADFFFAKQLPPYDLAELTPQKGDAAMALRALEHGAKVLETAEFSHDGLDSALRAEATALGIKAGQMFQPIRVAVCGRKVAPPLFETLEVLGRETALERIDQAIEMLRPTNAPVSADRQ
ncbi:MAG: glutamate--tRNA ligase, partial [Bryobacteraceae bacterium]